MRPPQRRSRNGGVMCTVPTPCALLSTIIQGLMPVYLSAKGESHFILEHVQVDTTLTTFLVNDLGFAPRRAPCLPDEMTRVLKRQKVENDPTAIGKKTDNTNKPLESTCPLQPGHSASPPAPPEFACDSIFTDLAQFFGMDGFGSPNLKSLPPKVSPEKEMSTTDEAGIPLPVNHAHFEPTQKSLMPVCSQQDFKIAGHTFKSGPLHARDLTQIEILLEMHLDTTNLKQVDPTKTGRRRRMIPLKTLDHQVRGFLQRVHSHCTVM